MSDIRTRIAEVLEGYCSHDCMASHGRAADAVLAMPGIAVVELPEPDDTDAQQSFWDSFVPNDDSMSAMRWPGSSVVCDGDEVSYQGDNYLPSEARAFAVALLAAADAAEKEHDQ